MEGQLFDARDHRCKNSDDIDDCKMARVRKDTDTSCSRSQQAATMPIHKVEVSNVRMIDGVFDWRHLITESSRILLQWHGVWPARGPVEPVLEHVLHVRALTSSW